MVFDFTEDEAREIEALEDSFDKLIKEAEKRVRAARQDAEPDEEALKAFDDRLDAIKRPAEPKEESPEAFSAYLKSPEYKAYLEEQKKIVDERIAFIETWENAGPEKWKKAREEVTRLENERKEARIKAYRRAQDRYFAELGDDPNDILKDACFQVIRIIESTYANYERKLNDDDYLSFSAFDVRLQEDGSFLLDKDETRNNIFVGLKRHLDAFKGDLTLYKRFTEYLEHTLETSPYITTYGVLGARIEKQKEKTKAVRPKKYVKTLTKVSDLAFDNKLMRPLDADPDSYYDVFLDSKRTVSARVAIDYKSLVETGFFTRLPELTGEDMDVHDAIVTLWYNGNRVMTYDMIYRAMTGKMQEKIRVSDDIYAQIDNALMKLRGVVDMKFEGIDKDKNKVTFIAEESIVFFRRKGVKVNGQYVARAIEVIEEPVFLRWAKTNRNELDTRDIKLLDVPQLNNGKESAGIRRALYRRIVQMRREFESDRKSRSELPENRRHIRYDYVYAELELENPDKAKRNLIKGKIDKIMEYWTSKGFISGYKHVRDSSHAYYAVEVSFLPKVPPQNT